MKLDIYSYNIHSGKNVFYKYSLHHIIQYFKQHHADILALQEVQNNSKYGWQYDLLKTNLNMFSVFGSNVSISDGSYGNAIFSKFPIINNQNHLFPRFKEQRGVISADIDVNGTVLKVFNTHLSLGKKEKTSQMKDINGFIQEAKFPTILMGDFNTTKPIDFTNMIDCGKAKRKEAQPTIFPLRRRIDYIFTSNLFNLLDYEIIPVTYSDHYPLKVTISL
jgi:endonuclease/exonuclease/phosphatase family metal-dependent hydrolase